MGSVYIYLNRIEEGAAALYAAKNIYEKIRLKDTISPFPELYMELLNYKSIIHGDSIDYYREASLIELNKVKVKYYLFAHYYEIFSHYFFLNSNLDSAEFYIKK